MNTRCDAEPLPGWEPIADLRESRDLLRAECGRQRRELDAAARDAIATGKLVADLRFEVEKAYRRGWEMAIETAAQLLEEDRLDDSAAAVRAVLKP